MAFGAHAQVYPNPNVAYAAPGSRVKVPVAFSFPTGCGTPSGTYGTFSGQAMQFYDSCNKRFYLLNPKTLIWDSVHVGVSGGASGWSLTGNTGTNPGTNFLGTTDNTGLMFKANNAQVGYIDIIRGNTSFGESSLQNNLTGSTNSAIGVSALTSNQSGAGNTGVGYGAGSNFVDGDNNTAIGFSALSPQSLHGSNNIGIGAYSGAYLADSSDRLFINSLNRTDGMDYFDSTYSIIYGYQNIAPGKQSLRLNSQIYLPYIGAGGTTDSVLTWNATSKMIRYKAFPSSGTTYSAGYGLRLISNVFSADTAYLATLLRLQKVGDSLGAIIATKGTGTIGGSIAANQIAYSSGSNTIAGTNNLYFDATQKQVGIGTNVPSTMAGQTGITGAVINVKETSGYGRLLAQGSIGALFALADNGAGSNVKYFQFRTDDGITRQEAINDAGSAVAYTFLAMDHSNGNVGVGTTAPNAKLEVVGGLMSTFTDGTYSTRINQKQTGIGGNMLMVGKRSDQPSDSTFIHVAPEDQESGLFSISTSNDFKSRVFVNASEAKIETLDGSGNNLGSMSFNPAGIKGTLGDTKEFLVEGFNADNKLSFNNGGSSEGSKFVFNSFDPTGTNLGNSTIYSKAGDGSYIYAYSEDESSGAKVGAKTDGTVVLESTAGVNITGRVTITTIPAYASDVAAGIAGLTTGAIYQTNGAGTGVFAFTGVLMVKQ